MNSSQFHRAMLETGEENARRRFYVGAAFYEGVASRSSEDFKLVVIMQNNGQRVVVDTTKVTAIEVMP